MTGDPLVWRGRSGLAELEQRIRDWAESDLRVHAMAVFGSSTRGDRPADDWSDLDVLLVVDDRAQWTDPERWVQAIAPIWLAFLHPSPIPGVDVHQVLFDGGYDADLVIVDPQTLERVTSDSAIAAGLLGSGHRIVFDRTGALSGLPVATSPSAATPTLASYDALVGQVLFQLVWATKRWRRGELWRTVDDLNSYLAGRYLTMLGWAITGAGIGGVAPDGRGLERWATAEQLATLATTSARHDRADAARAIKAFHAAFRPLALDVAQRSGFVYPIGADGRIEAWIADRLDGR